MNSIKYDNDDWRWAVEELRKFDGFQNISEEEAEQTIDFLVQLARIEYEIMLNNIEKQEFDSF